MAGLHPKLATVVEAYFEGLRRIRASGGGTGERSSYPPLTNLLNAVGASLKPKVFCISQVWAQQGAGHPDLGLYGARQVQKGKPPKAACGGLTGQRRCLADGREQAGASPLFIFRYPNPPSPIGN